MTTVLVVEDEIEIARVVRDYLRNAGFEVIVVGDGGSAVASVRSSKPDLLVLDLGLPGRDGLDVAREIRRWSTTPIVMLTARGDETDRIVGLEVGYRQRRGVRSPKLPVQAHRRRHGGIPLLCASHRRDNGKMLTEAGRVHKRRRGDADHWDAHQDA